jgi:hypothetical protein
MAAIEDVLETALYTTLSGDATLGALLSSTTAVYNTIVPEGTTAPYVVFQQQSATDRPTLARANASEWFAYAVKAVTYSQASDTSPAAAKAIRTRIDQLLNDQPLTLSTGTLMVCRRTQRIKYPELFDGLVIWHVGSLFQIGVST